MEDEEDPQAGDEGAEEPLEPVVDDTLAREDFRAIVDAGPDDVARKVEKTRGEPEQGEPGEGESGEGFLFCVSRDLRRLQHRVHHVVKDLRKGFHFEKSVCMNTVGRTMRIKNDNKDSQR